VDQPVMVFGRHKKGIPYDAIDGIPARLFFLLIAPTVTQHLAILARLGRLLRDPKLRKNLLAADSAEEIIALIREGEAKL
jgi:mannitol/fructose-specific phosphotransferase system IIA component (Ntr-type)